MILQQWYSMNDLRFSPSSTHMKVVKAVYVERTIATCARLDVFIAAAESCLGAKASEDVNRY